MKKTFELQQLDTFTHTSSRSNGPGQENMKMYISSTSLRFNLKLLFFGVTSVCILSGCTTARQRVQPYRDRPTPSEASRILPSKPPQQAEPVQNQPIYSQTPQEQQGNVFPPAEKPLYSNENQERNREFLRPVSATVRSRVSFYSQRTKAWQKLERNKTQYRTPEQSRKLISCQSKVAALHNAYTELQIQLFNERNLASSRDGILVTQQHLQHKDFSYLEGRCPTLFKQLFSSPQRFRPEPVILPERPRAPEASSGRTLFSPGQTRFNTSPQYQNQNQYNQGLQTPENRTITPPEPTPNYEERYQHAQSLLKQGREEEARRILSDLLASVRQTGNRTLQVKILKKMSALEFALRNYLPARILYEELQQLNAPFNRQHLIALQGVDAHRKEVDAYAALLLSSMTSDPEQDGFTVIQQARSFLHNFPASSMRSHVEQMAAKAEQEAEQWFRRFIQDFDRLVLNQQRQKALTLLEKVPLDILPLDKQEIIRKRKNALTAPPPVSVVPTPMRPEEMPTDSRINESVPQQTQQQAQEEQEHSVQEPPASQTTRTSSKSRKKASNPPAKKQVVETEVQKKWDKAEQALQTAEYDKAIALFSHLLNTSLDSQARKKIKKASQAAGQEARRKAANFFQRANSATDPKVKKQHLLSSKALLEDILQKYPLAGLDAKVRRNLSRVDKELTALDHMPE